MPKPAKLIKVKYVGSCDGCGSDQTVTLDMLPKGLKHCPPSYDVPCLLCEDAAPPITFELRIPRSVRSVTPA